MFVVRGTSVIIVITRTMDIIIVTIIITISRHCRQISLIIIIVVVIIILVFIVFLLHYRAHDMMQELVVVLLKALFLYDHGMVTDAIPPAKVCARRGWALMPLSLNKCSTSL